MSKMIRGLAMAMLVMLAGLANAQAVEEDPLAAFIASLQFQQGEVAVPEAKARLRLTEGFRYLGKADARRVLEEFWGNPPDDTVLGMLVPTADGLDSDHSWAVILTWSDDGYVSDEDAAEIDYAELLETMQAETRDANPARREAGYPTADLIGWAQPPRYDATAKRLHWAKHLQFEGSEGGTLNYDIRVLGREGYLSMSAIAGMADLDRVNDGMNEVLAMAEFEPGHRYADFNADTDRTAAYGLAALVGGGLAAKTGLLAKLGLFLAKFWKLLLIAGVGIVALVRKFGGKSKDEGGTAA
ncbi:DUF2167 domain-containing protein [Arenimonas sp.]|uniref:DUF2167 domain-containing protein n=1 Tax=Arenimonas sp. TaxID=1872635 RepID=UPI002E37D64D|nr:DUF2167 domain-containing protein [Arenimonas sp.]HEX4854261.1 DUF2167 domain-containing protein [Arenimonas sp.]